MSDLRNAEAVKAAYEDVRSDETTTNWCCVMYDEYGDFGLESTGEDFEELKSKLEDSERVYVFLRVQTDDEMKFAFITWIGPGVSPLKKAKVSTDKAFVKQQWADYTKEILMCDLAEFTEDHIIEEVKKAGGAN